MPADLILGELRGLRSADLPTHGGRTLAYVYDSGLSEVDKLGAAAHALFSPANALDPTAFPSLGKMENELVHYTADLLGGDEDTVGTVTSGGTESCLLAVLAARDAHPEITAPSIVLPSTAHAAFHKAAHYFGLRKVSVPVDPGTFRADPAAIAAVIDDTTVLVVASAPSYAHGVLDPITEIAAAAAARGVRMHVDACIGGWVLPFFVLNGVELPPFGLDVPGVTSISVDLHKYAYCPKGVSVLLHANAALRRPQYFASADWPGYTMLNTTMQSTRSGGPIAAAWATILHLGEKGYVQLAGDADIATTEIRHGIELLDGLRILGDPVSTLLSFTTDSTAYDLFTVADKMRARGWYVQPQFAHESSPMNLHLTITAANRRHEREFIDALAESVVAARRDGPVVIDPRTVAYVAALDPAELTGEQFQGVLKAAGMGAPHGVPSNMAHINALIACAPPPLRERLLLEFLGALYS
ncbi:aminotransferase class V-fold PLP-dependent enzyme [Amycolatopsis sp. H20-H5]|nr:aminotransferase class V-fold PLP-dependent enzyme [Amycolatopsis sp. H20-H5]MEC3980887.1 aminotransferase class V-fold PLP-dependent enzyme [Amycolatopsis sp. H20-H5]